MGIADFFLGSEPEVRSDSLLTGNQNDQLNRLLSYLESVSPFEGAPLDPFKSSLGFLAPPLTSTQRMSLAGLESLASGAQAVGGQRTGAEMGAEKTLSDIMSRSPGSEMWNDWFRSSVEAPLLTSLERNDISRGRQMTGSGTFLSTDRERGDLLGREAFWKQLADTRASAAVQNEDLRLRAAGQVPGLRTPQQVVTDTVGMFDSLIKGSDIERQSQREQIAMELQQYLTKLDWIHKWMGYQFAPLGISAKQNTAVPGSEGFLQGLLQAAATVAGSALSKPPNPEGGG